MDKITLRSAGEADLDAVTAVEAACFPQAEACPREVFRARLMKFPQSFIIAVHDGETVGLIDGLCTDRETLTDDLYEKDAVHLEDGPVQMIFGLAVLPQYQHLGIARSLMEELIRRSRQKNRKMLVLTCKARLKGFYAQFGFEDRGLSVSEHGGAEWYEMRLTL